VPDAVVALRSFRRRWNEVFTAAREHAGDAILTTHPADGAASPTDLAWHVADRFTALERALDEAMRHDRPDFGSALTSDAGAKGPGDGPDAAVAALGSAADALAGRAGRVTSGDWRRPIVVDGSLKAAAWLVQHGAHEGSHHLRTVERAVGEAAAS